MTKWITGLDLIRNQNCYLLNFGWSEELSLPQLRLVRGHENHFYERVRSSAPSNCFLVFIGGEYVNKVNEIVEKVDRVTEGLVTRPSVYFTEETDKKAELKRKSNFLVGRLSSLLQLTKIFRFNFQNKIMRLEFTFI